MKKKDGLIKELPKVIVTKRMVGLCYMQVCAHKKATTKQILDVCNRENASGTRGGWSEVIRKGDGKPVQCEDHADRKHYLIAC